MKLTDTISQIRTENKVEMKKARKAEETRAGADTISPDTVELSNNSRDVRKMQEILAQTPEMRMAMIDSLKKDTDAGTYQVNSRDIAEKMLSDLLDDETIVPQ